MAGRWSGAYEAGAATGYLVAATALSALGGVSPLNPALIAGAAAVALGLAFHRTAGVRGAIGGLPLFVGVYALAEAREGRAVASPALLPILVVVAVVTLGFALVRIRSGLKQDFDGHEKPERIEKDSGSDGVRKTSANLLLSLLLALLAFFSASGGGAEGMSPWFSWLPESVAWNTIIAVRKVIHATYYPLLAVTVLSIFGRARSNARANVPWAFAFTAIFAVFDEVRQSQVPGRSGSAWDVLLDLTAAAIVLAVVVRRIERRTTMKG